LQGLALLIFYIEKARFEKARFEKARFEKARFEKARFPNMPSASTA